MDTTTKNDTTAHDSRVGSSDLLGSVLRIEHGWLTIRTETGRLLWSKKCSDIDNNSGTDFAAVLSEAAKAHDEWKRDLVWAEDQAKAE